MSVISRSKADQSRIKGKSSINLRHHRYFRRFQAAHSTSQLKFNHITAHLSSTSTFFISQQNYNNFTATKQYFISKQLKSLQMAANPRQLPLKYRFVIFQASNAIITNLSQNTAHIVSNNSKLGLNSRNIAHFTLKTGNYSKIYTNSHFCTHS